MNDFFISHSSLDKKPIVDDFVEILVNMKFNVWYDKNEILAGDDILQTIKQGLANSYCLLLVITNNFMRSQWTFFETGLFDSYQNKRIIPILADVSPKYINKLQGILGNRKYINLNNLTREEVVEELIRCLKKTKQDNDDLCFKEKLTILQRQIASYETVSTGIISIKLKEYLDFQNSQQAYMLLAAKQLTQTIVKELLENSLGYSVNTMNNEKIVEILSNNTIGNANFRDHVKFIISQNYDTITPECIALLNRSLFLILTQYIHIACRMDFNNKQIELVLPNEFVYSDFVDMYEIDRKVLRNDLIADTETCWEWYEYNVYTHIAVRDSVSKKIVGYFSVLPITNEAYNKILSGSFKDRDFSIDALRQYNFSDFYRIYVAAVGIDPEYQNTGAFIMLYNALIDLFIALARDREIYISEVIAEASTRQGEKFCQMIGMKNLMTSDNDTDIYQLITIPPSFSLKNKKGKELYEICERKFEEYRDYFDKR